MVENLSSPEAAESWSESLSMLRNILEQKIRLWCTPKNHLRTRPVSGLSLGLELKSVRFAAS